MGRGWTILEAGNRGNVLIRSVGVQVYGDLSERVVVLGNCAGEECDRDKAPAGKSGAAKITSALSFVVHVAHLSMQDNGRSRRYCLIDGRLGNWCWKALSHADLGGPRMCWARAKVAMRSIGAPQCWHTKVGRAAPDPVRTWMGAAASTGTG